MSFWPILEHFNNAQGAALLFSQKTNCAVHVSQFIPDAPIVLMFNSSQVGSAHVAATALQISSDGSALTSVEGMAAAAHPDSRFVSSSIISGSTMPDMNDDGIDDGLVLLYSDTLKPRSTGPAWVCFVPVAPVSTWMPNDPLIDLKTAECGQFTPMPTSAVIPSLARVQVLPRRAWSSDAPEIVLSMRWEAGGELNSYLLRWDVSAAVVPQPTRQLNLPLSGLGFVFDTPNGFVGVGGAGWRGDDSGGAPIWLAALTAPSNFKTDLMLPLASGHSALEPGLVHPSSTASRAVPGLGLLSNLTILSVASGGYRESPLVFLAVESVAADPMIVTVSYGADGVSHVRPIDISHTSPPPLWRIQDVGVVFGFFSNDANEAELLLSVGTAAAPLGEFSPSHLCVTSIGLMEADGQLQPLCSRVRDIRTSATSTHSISFDDQSDPCGFWSTPLQFSALSLTVADVLSTAGTYTKSSRHGVILGVPSACRQDGNQPGSLLFLRGNGKMDNYFTTAMHSLDLVHLDAGASGAALLSNVNGFGLSVMEGPESWSVASNATSLLVSSKDESLFLVEVQSPGLGSQYSFGYGALFEFKLHFARVEQVQLAQALQPVLYTVDGNLNAASHVTQKLAQNVYLLSSRGRDWLGRSESSLVLSIEGPTAAQVRAIGALQLPSRPCRAAGNISVTLLENTTYQAAVWSHPTSGSTQDLHGWDSDKPAVLMMGSTGVFEVDVAAMGVDAIPAVTSAPTNTPSPTHTMTVTPTASATGSPAATMPENAAAVTASRTTTPTPTASRTPTLTPTASVTACPTPFPSQISMSQPVPQTLQPLPSPSPLVQTSATRSPSASPTRRPSLAPGVSPSGTPVALPALEVFPRSFAVTANHGEALSRSFALVVRSSTTTHWTVSLSRGDQAKLSLTFSQTSKPLGDGQTTHVIQVNLQGRATASTIARIALTPSHAQGVPRLFGRPTGDDLPAVAVPIHVTVNVPKAQLSPTSLYSSQLPGSAASSQVQLSNTGTAPLQWTATVSSASADNTWLAVSVDDDAAGSRLCLTPSNATYARMGACVGGARLMLAGTVPPGGRILLRVHTVSSSAASGGLFQGHVRLATNVPGATIVQLPVSMRATLLAVVPRELHLTVPPGGSGQMQLRLDALTDEAEVSVSLVRSHHPAWVQVLGAAVREAVPIRSAGRALSMIVRASHGGHQCVSQGQHHSSGPQDRFVCLGENQLSLRASIRFDFSVRALSTSSQFGQAVAGLSDSVIVPLSVSVGNGTIDTDTSGLSLMPARGVHNTSSGSQAVIVASSTEPRQLWLLARDSAHKPAAASLDAPVLNRMAPRPQRAQTLPGVDDVVFRASAFLLNASHTGLNLESRAPGSTLLFGSAKGHVMGRHAHNLNNMLHTHVVAPACDPIAERLSDSRTFCQCAPGFQLASLLPGARNITGTAAGSGLASNATETTRCIPCPDGTVRSVSDAPFTQCKRCSASQFADVSRTECLPCPNNGFSCAGGVLRPRMGTWCPTCSVRDSDLPQHPVLRSRMLARAAQVGLLSKSIPPSTNQGTGRLLQADQNSPATGVLQRVSNDSVVLPSTLILECTPAAACVPAADSSGVQCAPGHSGVACGECKPGWSRASNEELCLECEANSESIAFSVLMWLLNFGLILALTLKQPKIEQVLSNARHSPDGDTRATDVIGLFRLVASWAQVYSLLLSSKVPPRTALDGFVSTFSGSSTGVSSSAQYMQCTVGLTPYEELQALLLLPVVVVATPALLVLLFHKCKRDSPQPLPLKQKQKRDGQRQALHDKPRSPTSLTPKRKSKKKTRVATPAAAALKYSIDDSAQADEATGPSVSLEGRRLAWQRQGSSTEAAPLSPASMEASKNGTQSLNPLEHCLSMPAAHHTSGLLTPAAEAADTSSNEGAAAAMPMLSSEESSHERSQNHGTPSPAPQGAPSEADTDAHTGGHAANMYTPDAQPVPGASPENTANQHDGSASLGTGAAVHNEHTASAPAPQGSSSNSPRRSDSTQIAPIQYQLQSQTAALSPSRHASTKSHHRKQALSPVASVRSCTSRESLELEQLPSSHEACTQRGTRVAVLFLLLLHFGIVDTCLRILRLYDVPVLGARLLAANLQYGDMDDEFAFSQALAGLGLVVFGLGLPIAGVVALWRFRSPASLGSYSTQAYYGALYNGYKVGRPTLTGDRERNLWFWELLVVIPRKVLLTMIVALVSRPTMQAFLLNTVLTVALVLHVGMQPYQMRSMNIVEGIALGTLLGASTSGIILLDGQRHSAVQSPVEVALLLAVGAFIAATVFLAGHSVVQSKAGHARLAARRDGRDRPPPFWWLCGAGWCAAAGGRRGAYLCFLTVFGDEESQSRGKSTPRSP